jgi:23S rRNA (cytidine1920-2'-O)/16S rRNA (cytidine1409-2'-O)-methyltransferase
MPRRRLDVRVVELGLAESRSRAQALVMAGRVTVDGAVVDKAGAPVADEQLVEVVAPPRYVSRGGEKLETALRAFAIDVTGERCLDVGASTGGFTDCLLQHGAEHVIAVDVGRAQLHERLRADPRVTVLDGVNARSLAPDLLPYRAGFVTADVSFISLRTVLPAVVGCLAERWRGVVLVKPQFEAGRERVRKGVVREPEVHAEVLHHVAAAAESLGVTVLGVCDSSLPGPAGNREFLMELASAGHPLTTDQDVDLDRAIRHAVGSR